MTDARPEDAPPEDAPPEPVACTLGAGDLAGRMARWKAVATSAAGQRSATGHGVRLSFTAGPGVAGELRDLAALEGDCCSFATWTVREDGGQVLVDVTGGNPAAVTAVRAMFDPPGGWQ
jgi:hypothetical protein